MSNKKVVTKSKAISNRVNPSRCTAPGLLHLRRNLLLPQKMALLRQQLLLDLAMSNVLKS